MAPCSIKWCGKSSSNANFETNGITFHRFPSEPDYKEQWINATRRENWSPSPYSVICSRHFTKDCFINMKNRRRLLSSAVPTLCLPLLTDSEPSDSVAPSTSKLKRKTETGKQNTSVFVYTSTPENRKRKSNVESHSTNTLKTEPEENTETELSLEPISVKPIKSDCSQSNSKESNSVTPSTSKLKSNTDMGKQDTSMFVYTSTPANRKSYVTPISTHELKTEPGEKGIKLSPKPTSVTPISITPISLTPISLTPIIVTPISVTPTSATTMSVTSNSVNQNNTAPQFPPNYKTPAAVVKHLHKRIIELTSKVETKNKQLKNLRENNQYLKQKIKSLELKLNDNEKKNSDQDTQEFMDFPMDTEC